MKDCPQRRFFGWVVEHSLLRIGGESSWCDDGKHFVGFVEMNLSSVVASGDDQLIRRERDSHMKFDCILSNDLSFPLSLEATFAEDRDSVLVR